LNDICTIVCLTLGVRVRKKREKNYNFLNPSCVRTTALFSRDGLQVAHVIRDGLSSSCLESCAWSLKDEAVLVIVAGENLQAIFLC